MSGGHNRIAVIRLADGKRYESITEAAKDNYCDPKTIRNWMDKGRGFGGENSTKAKGMQDGFETVGP